MTTDVKIRDSGQHKVIITGETKLGNNWMMANLMGLNKENIDDLGNYVTLRPKEDINETVLDMELAGLTVDYK